MQYLVWSKAQNLKVNKKLFEKLKKEEKGKGGINTKNDGTQFKHLGGKVKNGRVPKRSLQVDD